MLQLLQLLVGAQQAGLLVIFAEIFFSYFQMEEVSLLVDTLKQLDELFLSVVVVSDRTLRLMLAELLFLFTRHFVDGMMYIEIWF